MKFEIGGRLVGPGEPVLIAAELSANHTGSIARAIESIRAAKRAGADAIKLQTYTADTMTIDCDSEIFKISQGTLWDGRTLHDLYQEAFTPWEWHEKLKKVAEEEGLIFFSTPFDKSAVDFLMDLGVPAFKIASFEFNDLPLIEYAASKGLPMIMSTGLSDRTGIEEALQAVRKTGNENIMLLKCTSAYPAPVEEANLFTIPDMEKNLGVLAGLSDHTMSATLPVASVALGARMIEKHFIVDRSWGGPDSAFSLDEKEFAAMVKAVRETESALGGIYYEPSERIKKNRKFQRSLFVVNSVAKGEVFTDKNVRSIRPGDGLAPKYFGDVIGRRAAKDIQYGTPLDWDLIEKEG